ncbi:MAG: aldehyde ferredoxin oxidoreductase C-terminal domain-containing protein [Bacillota bacterium]|nr:aldehyde ferredoxin oxidoreductase C-terminal domain-containing protein [Bacillota bacterium]
MVYGYVDKMIRFKLSEKNVITEDIPADILKEWLGGTGLGLKYFCEEVETGTTWDSPKNKLFFSTGPLAGTAVKGSGTYGTVTKGPMTGGIGTSQANGYMGAFLKFCGYQAMVLEGISKEWVYLYVDENNIQIKEASHLVGLDTIQTQEALYKEYGLNSNQLSIICIGPAGENLVRFACILGDYGHAAAHNGIGAVMGVKKVKAIVIKRGKKKFAIYDKSKLMDAAGKMNETAINSPAGSDCFRWGTNAGHPILHKSGALPVKNLTTSIFPENGKFSGESLRQKFNYKRKPCWACNFSHCGYTKVISGPFKGFVADEPEYEAMASMGPMIGITDPTLSLVLADYADRMGMDVNETGWLLAWVMECFEKGYLTAEEADNLELSWGSFYTAMLLLNNISKRHGFGNLLAEGVKGAAKKIGGSAQQCAVYTEKGNTPRSHDHRAVWTEYLDTCTSDTGTIEVTGGAMDVTQHNMKPIDDQFSWEQVARQNAAISGRRVVDDSLGICRISAAEDINLTAAALTAATGDDFSREQLMKIGKRIINLMRFYNSKSGLTSNLDKPSTRYAARPSDGPASDYRIGDVFNQMKELYYESMGWDKKTGEPLADILADLDLDALVKRIN